MHELRACLAEAPHPFSRGSVPSEGAVSTHGSDEFARTTSAGRIPVMQAIAKSDMSRSYHRRSAEERLADLQKKVSDLKAKQASKEKRDDPVLREIQKLQKRLKQFIQTAHDHKRPDVANSAMGFKAMLDRVVAAELGSLAQDPAGDEEEA